MRISNLIPCWEINGQKCPGLLSQDGTLDVAIRRVKLVGGRGGMLYNLRLLCTCRLFPGEYRNIGDLWVSSREVTLLECPECRQGHDGHHNGMLTCCSFSPSEYAGDGQLIQLLSPLDFRILDFWARYRELVATGKWRLPRLQAIGHIVRVCLDPKEADYLYVCRDCSDSRFVLGRVFKGGEVVWGKEGLESNERIQASVARTFSELQQQGLV